MTQFLSRILNVIILFLYCGLCFQSTTCNGQNQDSICLKKNTFYIEGLGNAGLGLYSLNYERKLYENKNGFLALRAGLSCTYEWFFPLSINGVFGEENHHTEVGLGKTLCFKVPLINKHGAKLDKDFSSITANVMYRYQKPGGRFIFRIGWTPVLYYNYIRPSWGIILITLLDCGASFGYAF